ncbi:MAG: bifunctional serine/threonine-protein kinase/formylglycine-generating enzyme family protein [Planctomycetaceae bacterium]
MSSGSIQIEIDGLSVRKHLGSGGMGDVFLALQQSLNRLVAVKFLKTQSQSTYGGSEERFRREAELASSISHPNVAQTLDFGTSEGRMYVVFEYLPGGSLRDRLQPDTPWSLNQAAQLLTPLLSGVKALHDKHMIHRDLKPENILFDDYGNAKICDFGLATLIGHAGDLTNSFESYGSYGYSSPEQQYRLPVDHRTDQYSLAAITYEVFTGRKPLGIIDPPSRHNSEVPPDMDAVLLRALQHDPDDRYATTDEFKLAIESILHRDLTPTRLPMVTGAVLIGAIALGAVWFVRNEAPSRSTVTGAAPESSDSNSSLVVKPNSEEQPHSFPNSLSMELVAIPSGQFTMGDGQADSDAAPCHDVRITRGFYIGRYEVTLNQFEQFVRATGYVTSAEKHGGRLYNEKTGAIEIHRDSTFRTEIYVDSQSSAVRQISWNDADAFCKWLSARENRTYRLPTEAEWEYVRRGRSTLDNGPHKAVSVLNDDNTRSGANSSENTFGVYNMRGGVWEWCHDWYGKYTAKPAQDPVGPPSGNERVMRGGAWYSPPEKLTWTHRNKDDPSLPWFSAGFRVVCLSYQEQDQTER